MLKQELKTIWKGKDPGEFRKFGKTMGVFLIIAGLVLYFLSAKYATGLILTGGLFLLLGLLGHHQKFGKREMLSFYCKHLKMEPRSICDNINI